ncbi:MAG TPA: F0F1 ATP synthase subunit A [Oculatellaceae cyanobacterium]
MLGKNLFLYQVVPGVEPHTLVGDIHVDTILLSATCMVGILAVCSTVTANLAVEGPGSKMQGVLEGLYTFVHDLAEQQIGHQHFKTFLPLIAAIFIFVLMANFIGVGPWRIFEHVPGWWHINNDIHEEMFEIASPTTDFNVTCGLALIALFTYLGSGFWKHGGHYAKILFGTPMAPIEILDMIVRPSTLALRLMVVITADELMRGSMLLICPYLLPAGIMGFELFIGCIQAFVFALLTSIYIGLTVKEHH